MASNNIEKTKSYTKVAAVLLHNSKDTRKNHEHSNKHIDINKTDDNISIDGLSYTERYTKYKDRVTAAKELYIKNHPTKGESVMENANVAMTMELPVPADIARKKDKYTAWCYAAYDILREHYGDENIICGDIHVDEVHDYYNAETGERCTSRPHLHVLMVPAVKEDCVTYHKMKRKDGSTYMQQRDHYAGELCLDAVYTSSSTIMMNQKIDKMTRQQFNCKWNTGEKSKSSATMEELKAASAKLAAEKETMNLKEIEEQKNKLLDEKKALEKDVNDLTGKRDKLTKRIAKLTNDESARQKSLDNATQRLETVNGHIADKYAALDVVQSELDALQSVVDARKSEIDEELGEYKKSKKSKIDENLEKYEKEQREKADKKAKAEAAEQQKIISEQARTILEQQQQLKQLDESIAEKQKADEYYQERIDENWAKNMEYVKENASLKKENAQLQGANHKMQLWYDFVGDRQAADMAFADYCQKMDGAAGSKLAKHNNIPQRSQQQQQSQYDRGFGDD